MTQAVAAVSSSEQGTVVVTEAGVSVLDRSGRRMRTLTSANAGGAIRRRLHMDGGESTPGLPADADWARGYDIEEVEDADDPRLADETAADADRTAWAGARSARIRPGVSPPPAVVTAGGSFAWVGLASGLWQVDLDDGAMVRAVPAAGGDARVVAASPDGQTVAFVQNRRLYRSRDGGQTFETNVSIPAPVRAVAAANTGAVLSVDAIDGVVRVLPPKGGDIESLGVSFAASVVSCGDAFTILSAGKLLAARGDPPTPTAAAVTPAAPAPPGTDHIACDARGRLLVAAASGQELRWSADGGRSWSVLEGRPPGSIIGMTVTESTIWIGASSGLWRMANPLWRPTGNAAGSCAACIPAAGTFGFRRPPPGSSAWWPTLLPRVDLMVATAGLGDRREVRGLVLLTFAVGARRARASAIGNAIDLDRPANRNEFGVGVCSVSATTTSDPIAVEESAALAQALKEPP